MDDDQQKRRRPEQPEAQVATERAAAGAPPRKDDEKAHHELYVGLRNWLCREDGGVYPPDTDLLPVPFLVTAAETPGNHEPRLAMLDTTKTISADDATARFGTDRRVGRVKIVTADQRISVRYSSSAGLSESRDTPVMRQKLAAGGAAHQPVTHRVAGVGVRPAR